MAAKPLVAESSTATVQGGGKKSPPAFFGSKLGSNGTVSLNQGLPDRYSKGQRQLVNDIEY